MATKIRLTRIQAHARCSVGGLGESAGAPVKGLFCGFFTPAIQGIELGVLRWGDPFPGSYPCREPSLPGARQEKEPPRLSLRIASILRLLLPWLNAKGKSCMICAKKSLEHVARFLIYRLGDEAVFCVNRS